MADGPLADGAPVAAGGVDLLVCTTCRPPGASLGADLRGDPGAPRPGAVLVQALTQALAAGALAGGSPAGLRILGVECLSNCARPCTVALRGPGRWTYVYGDLDPARDLPALLEGAAKYRAAPDGLVPWRDRPEHFRKHCIARIPPLES